MELTDRKKRILKIVVEEYVAAAEPVGSKAIAQRMPGKISSATIRNELAGIDKELDLLPSSIIAPISDMKISHLGHRNPRLHSDEVLIALSISAVTNPLAERVLKKLDDLRGCDAHFSVIISEEDEKLYKRLGIHVSCQPRYEIKRLYHK